MWCQRNAFIVGLLLVFVAPSVRGKRLLPKEREREREREREKGGGGGERRRFTIMNGQDVQPKLRHSFFVRYRCNELRSKRCRYRGLFLY